MLPTYYKKCPNQVWTIGTPLFLENNPFLLIGWLYKHGLEYLQNMSATVAAYVTAMSPDH